MEVRPAFSPGLMKKIERLVFFVKERGLYIIAIECISNVFKKITSARNNNQMVLHLQLLVMERFNYVVEEEDFWRLI